MKLDEAGSKGKYRMYFNLIWLTLLVLNRLPLAMFHYERGTSLSEDHSPLPNGFGIRKAGSQTESYVL